MLYRFKALKKSLVMLFCIRKVTFTDFVALLTREILSLNIEKPHCIILLLLEKQTVINLYKQNVTY